MQRRNTLTPETKEHTAARRGTTQKQTKIEKLQKFNFFLQLEQLKKKPKKKKLKPIPAPKPDKDELKELKLQIEQQAKTITEKYISGASNCFFSHFFSLGAHLQECKDYAS